MRMQHNVAIAVVAAAAAISIALAKAEAQRIAPRGMTRQVMVSDTGSQPAPVAPPSKAPAFVLGTLSAVGGGAALGALVAYWSCSQAKSDMCGLAFIPGAALGESLGAAIGVHAMERSRGNLALETLINLGVLTVGGFASAGMGNGLPMLFVIPAQVGLNIALERRR